MNPMVDVPGLVESANVELWTREAQNLTGTSSMIELSFTEEQIEKLPP
jgi:hypothetical protein